jgi:hypothetical protein
MDCGPALTPARYWILYSLNYFLSKGLSTVTRVGYSSGIVILSPVRNPNRWPEIINVSFSSSVIDIITKSEQAEPCRIRQRFRMCRRPGSVVFFETPALRVARLPHCTSELAAYVGIGCEVIGSNLHFAPPPPFGYTKLALGLFSAIRWSHGHLTTMSP